MNFTSSSTWRLELPTVTGADYNVGIIFRNCLMASGHNVGVVSILTTGALANKGGGIEFWNCTILGGNTGISTGANVSATIPCKVYNCLIWSDKAYAAGLTDNIVEDYNLLLTGATVSSGITALGANTQSTATNYKYAPLLEIGQSFQQGFQGRGFLEPMPTSPLLGFGNQASGPTTDAFARPRPSGPGVPWANALSSVGWLERGGTGTREIATVRTGSNALKLLGPATQDFDLPVNATSTTVTVYGRYDGTYAGTLPQMIVRNGEEAGVATATATMAGAADTWEQLSLNFTPTQAGIVTIRLQSNSTAGGGAAFFDDFAVT